MQEHVLDNCSAHVLNNSTSFRDEDDYDDEEEERGAEGISEL